MTLCLLGTTFGSLLLQSQLNSGGLTNGQQTQIAVQALQLQVRRAINDTHSALAQFGSDLVVSESVTNHEAISPRWRWARKRYWAKAPILEHCYCNFLFWFGQGHLPDPRPSR
jgi:hypothetical protein